MREISDDEWTDVSPPPVPPRDTDDEERKSFYSTFSYRLRNASVISRSSRVFVREDLMLPERGGQVISAEIGEKWDMGAYEQCLGKPERRDIRDLAEFIYLFIRSQFFGPG